jgi:alkyl sulfatase BDS1-like metallo-beta-lactamase superfamily hydrolase
LTIENAVLHFSKNRQAADADVTVTLSRPALNQMMFTDINLDEKISSGQVKLVGNKEKLREFLSMLDSFEFWFNIVTP